MRTKASLLLLCLFFTFSKGAFAVEQRLPNILFVYTDDQAAWAVGTAIEKGWFDDVPAAKTPNIDRLAREGATFANFFCTTPVCSPARATQMTGRYASEFGIRDFIVQPGHKLYDTNPPVALDPKTSITFAEVLKQKGYTTGLVGKWHLGDWTAKGKQQFHPTNHGFDYFMGLTGGGTRPNNPELEENGKVRKFKGLTTDILTDRALKFIKRSKDKPFLLCLHTRAPHSAWLPVAPEDWAPYEKLDPTIPNPDYPDLNIKRMKRQMREYLASTSGVDRNLGRVLALLDQLEIADNTIVIFSSDHGYNMGHNGIWHKGNGIWATKSPPSGVRNGTRVISSKYRPNLYDHSLRVPMIIRWPGVIEKGTVIKQTASSLDFFPTILAMAEAKSSTKKPLPGRNLFPLLQGKTPANWNQDLFAEYHMIHYTEANLRCYRTPKYKLIRDSHNKGCDEFYDLANDPSESVNLINDQRPEIQSAIRSLQAKLDQQPNLLKPK